MGVFAVDINFGKHGEADAVVFLTEGGDFGFCAGFLMIKLIAGEAENDKAFVFVRFVELLEAFILRGETTFAGGVDNEDDFAFVVGHGLLVAIDGGCGKVIECFVCHREPFFWVLYFKLIITTTIIT